MMYFIMEYFEEDLIVGRYQEGKLYFLVQGSGLLVNHFPDDLTEYKFICYRGLQHPTPDYKTVKVGTIDECRAYVEKYIIGKELLK